MRLLKVVTLSENAKSWRWGVASADDGHIVARGLASSCEAAFEEANRVKATAANPTANPALCLLAQ